MRLPPASPHVARAPIHHRRRRPGAAGGRAFRAVHDARAGPGDVGVAVHHEDPTRRGRQGDRTTTAGAAPRARSARARATIVPAGRDDDHLRRGLPQPLPADVRALLAHDAEGVRAARKGDHLRPPVARDEGRVEPFEERDTRPRPPCHRPLTAASRASSASTTGTARSGRPGRLRNPANIRPDSPPCSAVRARGRSAPPAAMRATRSTSGKAMEQTSQSACVTISVGCNVRIMAASSV